MKFKNQLFLALTFSTLLLGGCESFKNSTRNLTSQNVTQNPSNRYRISVLFDTSDAHIVKSSIKPQIVIDGKVLPLNIDKENSSIYFYDHEMTPNRTKAKYYFQIDYDYLKLGATKHKSFQSKLYELNVINRYAIEMECDRGVVGSKVVIIGRGFKTDDQVLFGEELCTTEFESTNSIHFEVPRVTVGKQYTVKIVSDNDTMNVGSFYVDGGNLSSNVDSIVMSTNDTTMLMLISDSVALAEGIDIQLSTNIPDSIKIKSTTRILPTAKAVSIAVKSTENAGDGMIVAHADGFNDVAIPVSVHSDKENISNEILDNGNAKPKNKNFQEGKANSIFVE